MVNHVGQLGEIGNEDDAVALKNRFRAIDEPEDDALGPVARRPCEARPSGDERFGVERHVAGSAAAIEPRAGDVDDEGRVDALAPR